MEIKPKKINIKVEVSVSEETMSALMAYRDRRGFPSLDETISELLASKLGKSSSPMWTDSEILAIQDSGKKILKALSIRPMSPSEISQETGIEGNELRAHLAHLSRRYKKLIKEPLHVWNDGIEKYELNPKYFDTISRILGS